MEEAERINSRIAEQVVSLKYGFIPRGSYVHTTKHCNILSVTYNSKKNQYVILDSRGVSTWSKSNKYNYFNRLKDFNASEFNSLLSVTYSKAANLYICLTRDYDIKLCNMGFIEVLLIDLDGTTLPKVAYDSKTNEIVVISRKKVQFWKISINDSNRVGEGSRLQREFDVPSTSLVTNAEYDDEFKFIYLISHNMIWCYDADLINFAQFDHPKIACSSFKTCTYFKRTNVFATGMSTGEIPIYSYSGGLIQTLRKHTRAVTSLLPHPRDPFLFLSSSMDGYVKIFSLQIYDEIYSISVFADGIKWMNFQSPLSLYCASLSTVKVFDINHICSFWSTVRSPVHNIDLHPKLAGKTSHIVVQDADKCIRIYNRRSGNKLCTVLPPPETFFENGMPSYSYDKVGKIIYILFKETDLWIYLTRTDPATRVNVWNIQNILESKVSDIKNSDESNDLDDFGIGLFRKREAKEDVICLCTETIARDVFQMNPLADLTQPCFDLLMCGMSNGKVYFLDPSPPLTVNLGFVAHTNCPVVDLKTLYDSLTSPVRILSLIKTSSNLCVKIWNANDFSADEQVAQQEYVLPITTLHNERSEVGSKLLIKPSQQQPSSSTVNVRAKPTQNNLHKPKDKNVRSKSPRKSPAPTKTRKVPKKGKVAVGSDSSDEEEEEDDEVEQENVEFIQSGGRQSPEDLVSHNESGGTVVKSSTVESVLKMSSGETVVDSSSGELIVFLSSSDETMEGMTSGDTFTEGSIPCYVSEEGDTTPMSVSSPGIPDITNTTPNGTNETMIEVKSQQSKLIGQIPSIVIITATPEMSSDTSSECVPHEQPVTNVTINRMTSEESYEEMTPEVSTERKYSSSSHDSSIVEENKSESINTTNSCAQVLSHNVSDVSHSSYDLDHNEWDGSGFISMTPSGRHYTQNESLFRIRDEDGIYYNMRSEDSMRRNPGASNSTPVYPLNKVEVKLGAFSEHCKRCPTSCEDIGLHLEENLKRQSTQETVKCTSFPIPDSEIVLTSISSHDRASLQSVKMNLDIKPKESVKKVEQSKLIVKKTPGRIATKSREQVMLVNRVKRQSLQYNSPKDLLLNKSILNDSNNNNEVSLVNEDNNDVNEDKEKNEVRTTNNEKVEKNQSDLNKIIESSESSEFEQTTNSDISKSKETIKSSISHDESVVADDLNDFLFKVNVTRPRQKHFPQLEPIKKADMMKLNSIYTKQLRDTLKKTSKFQEEQKKKRAEERKRKKEEKELLVLKEADEKNEDEDLTSDSMEMTVDQPYVDVKVRGRGITKKMIPGSFYHEQKQPFNSHVNSDDEEEFIDENMIIHEKSYRGKQRQKLSDTTSEQVLYKLAMDDPDFHGNIKEENEHPLGIEQGHKTSMHLSRRTSDENKDPYEMEYIKSTKLDVSKNQKVSKDLFTEIKEKEEEQSRENNRASMNFSKPKDSIEKLNIRSRGKKGGVYLSAPENYDNEKNLMNSLSVSSLQIPAHHLNESDNIMNMNTMNDKDSMDNYERKCPHHNIDEIENPLKIVSISNKYYNHNIDSLTEEYFDIKREEATKKKHERKEVPVSTLYEFCSTPPKKTSVSPTLMDYYFKGKCRRSPPVRFRSNSRGSHGRPPNNSPSGLSSPFSDNTYSNKMYVNTYVKESRLSSGYGTHSPCSNNSEKSKKRLTIKASPIYHGYLSDNVNKCHSKSTCNEKTSVLLSKDERLAKAKKLETKLSGQTHRLFKEKSKNDVADDKVNYMFLKSAKEGREFLQTMKTRTVSIPKNKRIDINPTSRKSIQI